MSASPPVSVIIPSYNRADKLASTLVSVFRQTIPPTLVIVVDDGSTDGTSELVSSFSVEHPAWRERLLYLRQENRGKSVALNEGLKHVTTEWVSYNDSDDLWHPEKLEKQFQVLLRHPKCGACVADTRYGRNGRQTTMEMGGLILSQPHGILDSASQIFCRLAHGVMMQTLVVRRDVMEKVGPFDPVLRAGQDVDIMFRISLCTGFCYVNEPLVELDREQDCPSRLTELYPMNSVARLGLRVGMIENWVNLTDSQCPEMSGTVRKRLVSAQSSLANQLLEERQFEMAAHEIRRAYNALRDPRMLIKWALVRVWPQLARSWVKGRMSSSRTAA
jgi:glycosyltransferase involved in cell wall biosynthesis